MNIMSGLVTTTVLLLLSAPTSANEIYIEQSGDNLEMTVVQEGSDNQVMPIGITSKLNGDDLTLSITQKGDTNLIEGNVNGNSNTSDLRQTSDDNFQRVSVVGSNNDVKVYQGTQSDGTVDVDETGGHEAYWTVTGGSNTVASYQTDETRGGGGGAAHHLANVVNGDNNVVEHTQRGKAGHDGFVEIQGDGNDVKLYQRGRNGQQWADIVLTGDGHTVDASQGGSMGHTFEVDLTNGGGAYSVISNQTTNNTTTSKTYSLTGICTNGNGCSVTVSQN
jgi:hypothetical protein